MKNLKRTIAAILAVVIILLMMAPLATAESYTQEVPNINLRGFMSYTIYQDKDDPNSERVFPPTKDAIIGTVKDIVPALAKLAIDGNWDVFGDILFPAVNKMLEPASYDKNGDAKYNTGVHFSYPTKQELIENGLDVEFEYDWRADPFKSAAELNDFVNYLTDELGYTKVTLESHSFAGIIMLTYLATYGSEKVKSCCFNSTAVFGAQFAGELVKGNTTVSDEALVEFLKGLFDHNELEVIIDSLVDLLKDAGLTGFVSTFVNNLFLKLPDRIWTECIIPLLGCWPSIWAMVPDEDYNEGFDRIFNGLYADSKDEFSVLHSKMNRFNTEIKANRKEALNKVNDSDTNLYVIARYGYPGVPIGDLWNTNADTVLTTEAESFGAECKNYNYSLIKPKNERYVSPNGAINASTCLFPDQTWFIRDVKHSQKDESLVKFAKTLLSSDSQATIDTFEEYPQFLLYNAITEKLMIDGNQNFVRNSFLKYITEFFKKIFDFYKKIFHR